jgi:hypothetical protein
VVGGATAPSLGRPGTLEPANRQGDLFSVGLRTFALDVNRYDRLTDDVAEILGRPATSVRDYVARRTDLFKRGVSS